MTGCCCLGKYCVVVCVREAVVCTEHHVASFCSDRRRRFVRPLGSLGIFRSVPLPPFCLFFFFFSPTSHPSYPSFSHPLTPPPSPYLPTPHPLLCSSPPPPPPASQARCLSSLSHAFSRASLQRRCRRSRCGSEAGRRLKKLGKEL